MKEKFRVYFSQVNQSFHEVEATTREGAIIKATAEWKKENGHPTVTYVEEA